MHSNVMHRFMVQALQDPPLCSSTIGEGRKINSKGIMLRYHDATVPGTVGSTTAETLARA
jgi:hypothetical protein